MTKSVRAKAMVMAAVTILGALCSALHAQAPTSVWDGIYTTDQAQRGGGFYSKECSSCHGQKLEGKGQAPPLVGSEFMMNWNGQTVADLFEKMQTSMPADRPGQLSKDENADILAFILQSGKFPAGMAEIRGDTESLAKIRIEASKASK